MPNNIPGFIYYKYMYICKYVGMQRVVVNPIDESIEYHRRTLKLLECGKPKIFTKNEQEDV